MVKMLAESVFICVHPWLNFPAGIQIAFDPVRGIVAATEPNPTLHRKIMETVETLKSEIKKLSSQAIQSKMDLHDLSEELPTNLERIPEVAQKTFQIYEKLIAAKQKLAALGV